MTDHIHIVSRGTYLAIFLILMVLLAATVGVARVDLGRLNLFVALLIATAKAILIVLYFMHLRWSTQLTRIFAGAGFAWLVLLLVITLSDFVSRHPSILGH